MTQDEIICMARELATRHGIRMCDEDGETHGEELYCVDVDDIAEIIKQVAAPVRTKDLTDDEVDEIFAEYGTIPNTKAVRAVIAADRELNK